MMNRKPQMLASSLGLAALIIGSCNSGASKGKIENSKQTSSDKSTYLDESERTDFYDNEDNTKVEEASDILKDPKVDALKSKIKSGSDPFKGCGYTKLSDGDKATLPDSDLLSPESKYAATVREGPFNTKVNVKIIISSTLELSGSQSDFKISNGMTVVSASPSQAKGPANDMVKKLSGIASFEGATQEDIQTLLEAPEASPICGLLMATTQKFQSSDAKTYINVTFSQPMVMMLNPKVSVARIKLQLIKPIVIKNISAQFDTNDSDIIKSGLAKTGESEIALIAPTTSIMDSVGRAVDIESEVAYRITNKFQSDGEKNGSPLDQISEFYISKGEVTHVVVKTPKPELPIIVYTVR